MNCKKTSIRRAAPNGFLIEMFRREWIGGDEEIDFAVLEEVGEFHGFTEFLTESEAVEYFNIAVAAARNTPNWTAQAAYDEAWR